MKKIIEDLMFDLTDTYHELVLKEFSDTPNYQELLEKHVKKCKELLKELKNEKNNV